MTPAERALILLLIGAVKMLLREQVARGAAKVIAELDAAVVALREEDINRG